MNSIRKLLLAIFCLLFIILMVEISFFYLKSYKEPLNRNTEASTLIPTPTEEPKQFILDRFEGTSKLIKEDLANSVDLTISFDGKVTEIDNKPGETDVPGFTHIEGQPITPVKGGIKKYKKKIVFEDMEGNAKGQKYTFYQKEYSILDFKDISNGKENSLDISNVHIGDMVRISYTFDMTANSNGESGQSIIFERYKKANGNL